MAKTRKATAGERIVRKHGPFVHRDTKVPLAKDIDALVRRAVREAWKARGFYEHAILSDTYGMDNLDCEMNRLPPIAKENIHIGCECCSTASQVAHLDSVIAVGFGTAVIERDGEVVYDGERAMNNGEEPKTVADAEAMAASDPDHDWRIVKHGPLHGETYQRHEPGRWVCVESNQGFA